MSRSLNRVELIGHLGKDAETKFTPSGVSCTNFSIATNRRWKDKQSGEWKEETDWHRCVLWRSENLSSYLTKGKQIWIEGRLQTRQWDDNGTTRYVTEVVVSDVILLGGGGKDQGQPPAQANGAAAAVPRGKQTERVAPDDALGIKDDDVPF
jgi:single-strand DNA-binding protein